MTQTVEIPPKCQLLRSKEQIEISLPFLHYIHKVSIVNAGLWGSFALIGLCFGTIPVQYTPLERFLAFVSIGCALIFVAICILAAIFGFVMRQKIVVTKERITMHTTLFPLIRRNFDISLVERVTDTLDLEDWSEDLTYLHNYGILIVDKNDDYHVLVQGLRDCEQVEWATQEINTFLRSKRTQI